MKYTFCEKLMWFALAGPSFKYLEIQGKSVNQKKAKDIHRFAMEHEELLVLHPERWAEEVKHCCGVL